MSTEQKQAAAYGSWKSPLTAAAVAAASGSVGSVVVDQATQPSRVYWLESRPSEGGRRALVSKLVDDYSDASLVEHTPDAKWNVRTAVHEYGGGAYAVHDGVVVFANWSDQGVYVLDTRRPHDGPRRIGMQDDRLRYAAFALHPSCRFAVCVREDHRAAGGEPHNALVAVPLAGAGAEVELFAQTDFVSSPVLSSLGDEIAFYTWNHPDMNWDATTLHRARLLLDAATGLPTGLGDLAVVAGAAGQARESIYQPRFDADGVLHFLSDRADGFWNPYFVDPDTRAVEPALAQPMAAEFAAPEWSFGESTFQPVPGRRFGMAVAYAGADAVPTLGILNVATHQIEELPTPGWSVLDNFQLATTRSGEPVLVLVAGGPAEPSALFTYYINGMTAARLLPPGSSSSAAPVQTADAAFISVPRSISFPTQLPPFGDKGEPAEAYAYFYPPTSRDYCGRAGELPPLLVLSHGGPTSAAHSVYQPKIQFWTSRGFAVADVNYGGSTGYGRAYRERLYPHFGIVDVHDCCAAALFLADSGLVDRRRLAIMGGSAGGFTTLACLAFRPEVFAVGASLYGISDLEVLAKETHKFEAQYPVHLVGAYPQERAEYIRRSPLHSVDSLACPAIFLQGLEDKVVPPNQAALMVAALKAKGIPVAHIEFAGEQHGFRQAKNIIRALGAQLYFFGRILHFTPADPIEPVPIDNDGSL
ncbi:Esterase lipase thioesterase active site [Coemansia thaxteri]|uniref:Esterase lipase thioesterase active site n=1 Tax=Coemansia thaxteri TaxID=2663907 RepID=A0A9W8EGR7_9FUNG|nr:Esterase lipase thioesterase active site [Coemansia thaxteri]